MFGGRGYFNIEVVLVATLDSLAQNKIPQVFTKLQRKGLTDTFVIVRPTNTPDGKGGLIKTKTENLPEIPCIITKSSRQPENKDIAGRDTTTKFYKLMHPRVYNGDIVDCKDADSLKVRARGMEPERTFIIDGNMNIFGIYVEVECYEQ